MGFVGALETTSLELELLNIDRAEIDGKKKLFFVTYIALGCFALLSVQSNNHLPISLLFPHTHIFTASLSMSTVGLHYSCTGCNLIRQHTLIPQHDPLSFSLSFSLSFTHSGTNTNTHTNDVYY